MSRNIVLIGAGSIQFGCEALGDIFQSTILHGSHIVLHDINEKALASTHAKAEQFIQKHDLNFTVSSTLNRREALTQADFVISSIEVGDRFALWDMDWSIPQQYGIRQVYGENGGPGGLFHSLRIIPPILDICSDVMDICPDAWVFNFSNPMSRICTTVYRKFPAIKFIGLCHEIASLKRHLPEILGVDYDKLKVRAAGLNHFSVMLEAVYKETGKDAYPDVRANSEKYFRSCPGYSDLYQNFKNTGEVVQTESSSPYDYPDDMVASRPWSDHTLFKEVLDKFDYFPITTDSHFGEYIQWAHQVSDHRGIKDFYDFYRAALGKGPCEIELIEKERVVSIIEGILTNSGYEEAAVNVPNTGQLIRNLPEWMCVEVPALVNSEGLQGIAVDMPPGIGGLLTNQIAVHDLTAQAVLEQSRELVIQALLVDPVVDQCSRIPEMVDAFIERQSPWLDYLK